MSIKLFEHNQSAYESVLEMLSDECKAAVVHPTGIGKSYIGFKPVSSSLKRLFAGYRRLNIFLTHSLKI